MADSASWFDMLQDGMKACADKIGDLSFENARLTEENEKLRKENEKLRHMVQTAVAEASELMVPMPRVFGQNETYVRLERESSDNSSGSEDSGSFAQVVAYMKKQLHSGSVETAARPPAVPGTGEMRLHKRGEQVVILE